MTAPSTRKLQTIDVRLSTGPSGKWQVWMIFTDGTSQLHSLHETRVDAEREGMKVSNRTSSAIVRLHDITVTQADGGLWHMKLAYSDGSTRLQGVYSKEADAEFAALQMKRTVLDMADGHFFNGKHVVVTGRMAKSRAEIEKDLANVGAIVQRSVGRTTDYLICGADVGDVKTRAAENYGVKMLNRDDYRNAMSGVTAQVEAVKPKLTHDEFVASLPESYGDF